MPAAIVDVQSVFVRKKCVSASAHIAESESAPRPGVGEDHPSSASSQEERDVEAMVL